MKRKYNIKSKKVWYGDELYKSILEARWAVFFDCLGIKAIYEPEWSEVETGCRIVNYKPDFFLPDLKKYIEIKPDKPCKIENIKAAGWSKDIGDIVVLFNLNPPTETLENGWLFFFEESHSTPRLSENIWWCECPKCGYIDLEQYGLLDSCGCFTHQDLNSMYNAEEEKGIIIIPNFERSERLLSAYKIAKNHKINKGKSKRVSKLPFQSNFF